MFKAIVNDTRSWSNSIDAIAALIDEGSFVIDESGIKLRAMDPSQIALVDFILPAKGFEKFEVSKTVSIGVDLLELSKITKRSKPEDKIELSFDGSRLRMVFRGDTTRIFSLSVMEAASNPPREPKIEFSADIKITPAIIKDALKDAELVSNHVALSAEGGLAIRADGDTGSVDIALKEDKLLSVNIKSPARAVFSLDHLNNILKEAEAPSVVSLSLKNDAPLRVEYAIGDARVVYYLAPRIESA
ncbi:MAG: proliferating cell nuclear antigen (pcna) [Candidatus Altiarchaeota archaeon]|nr:proliferating cell nuclear antigen (pcna) [Candidatus Altiarchaeota archaeon]